MGSFHDFDFFSPKRQEYFGETIMLKMNQLCKLERKQSQLITGTCLLKDVFKSQKIFKETIGFQQMILNQWLQILSLPYQVQFWFDTTTKYSYEILIMNSSLWQDKTHPWNTASLLNFYHSLKRGLDLLMLKIWGL